MDKKIVFLNSLILCAYIATLSFTDTQGGYAFLLLLVFFSGILLQIITATAFRQEKCDFKYISAVLIRFVSFLTVPVYVSHDLNAYIVPVVIVICVVIDVWQFKNGRINLKIAENTFTSDEKSKFELFYKSLFITSALISSFINSTLYISSALTFLSLHYIICLEDKKIKQLHWIKFFVMYFLRAGREFIEYETFAIYAIIACDIAVSSLMRYRLIQKKGE